MRSAVRVLAIVVTFHPERHTLSSLLNALCAQVDEVLVVDNTPAVDDGVWGMLALGAQEQTGLRMLRLGSNQGIATALNVGIEVALAEGFSHVLLSDQDSLPAEGMVNGLLRAEDRTLAAGRKVGGVGPVYLDQVTGIRFPFQVREPGDLFYSRKSVDERNPDIETLSLISSGTLIRLSVLKDVGSMLESLFIDYVDVEWCHRAVAKGYVLVGTNDALMYHNRGEQCLSVWFFGWRKFNGYGATRLYYQFRNFVYLAKLGYVPLYWKIRASWYWLGNFYAGAVFGAERLACTKAMLVGVRDGLLGNMGARRIDAGKR